MVEWLRRHVRRAKEPEYGRRVLDRYRMGKRSGGAIRAVRILTAPDCCRACSALGGAVYELDDAPLLPLAACTHPDGCRCTYIPVMAYDGAEPAEIGR